MGRRSSAFGELMGGRGLFDDQMIEEMADERDSELFRHRLNEGEGEFWGQQHGYNDSSELTGNLRADGRQRESLLTEGFPGGMRPTAPSMRQLIADGGRSGWPGHNDSMPEGAIGYLSEEEMESLRKGPRQPDRFGNTGRDLSGITWDDPEGRYKHPMDELIDAEYVRWWD